MFGILAAAGCKRSPASQRDNAMKSAKEAKAAKDHGRAIFFFRAAAKAVPSDPEPHYQAALSYLEVGDVPNGVAELKQTITVDPTRKDAQLKLAEIYALSRNKDLIAEAQQRANQILTADPTDSGALNVLGLVELEAGKDSDAAGHFEKSIASKPDSVQAASALAALRLKANDKPGAEKIMADAVARAPKSADIAIAAGRLYLSVREPAKAEAEFRRATQIDAKNGQAWSSLATAFAVQGRKPEAGQALATLSALDDPATRPAHASFLMEERRYAEAVAELNALYKAHPKERLVRSRLVAAYLANGQPGEAEAVLAEVVAKNPKDADALMQRAAVYVKDGKLKEAEKDATDAIQFLPDSPQAHSLLGEIYRSGGMVENQRKELNEAIRLQPRFTEARLALARSYLGAKDYRIALATVDAAPADQKNNPALRTVRNWALIGVGNLADAAKGIEAAVVNTKAADPWVQKGVLAGMQKQWPESRAAFEKALDLDPDNVRALRFLAQTYSQANQQPTALAKVKEYTAKRPKSPRMQHYLGEVLASSRDSAGARAAFAAAKAANPKYLAADWSLARLDLSEGKTKEARQLLENSVAADPLAAEPLLLLAELSSREGSNGEAIDYYRKLNRIQPSNLLVLNNLAYLLGEGDHLDEAEQYGKEALRLEPNNAALEDTVGWIEYRKGNVREALPYLERAVKTDGTPAENTIWRSRNSSWEIERPVTGWSPKQ